MPPAVAQAPLDDAVPLRRISRTLKALAGQWQAATPLQVDGANRYAGCDDLNVQAAIEQLGVDGGRILAKNLSPTVGDLKVGAARGNEQSGL